MTTERWAALSHSLFRVYVRRIAFLLSFQLIGLKNSSEILPLPSPKQLRAGSDFLFPKGGKP
jgi:hypothetical protein